MFSNLTAGTEARLITSFIFLLTSFKFDRQLRLFSGMLLSLSLSAGTLNSNCQEQTEEPEPNQGQTFFPFPSSVCWWLRKTINCQRNCEGELITIHSLKSCLLAFPWVGKSLRGSRDGGLVPGFRHHFLVVQRGVHMLKFKLFWF